MAAQTGFLASLLQLIAPQPCYDEFFVKFNLLHVPCLKVALSKVLGYAIIAGAVMVKVPQIMKIVRAGSAEGINIFGLTLEILAIMASFVYSFVNSFPFSTYGETVFLLLQTLIVAVLVLSYTGRTAIAVVYSAVLAGLLAFLISPAAPANLIWLMQASNVPNVVIARMLQAFDNFRAGSTGQLSAITCFMLWAGSLARIFTSAQETGDTTVILTYVVANFCNMVILLQIFWYWNATPAAADKVKKAKKAKKES